MAGPRNRALTLVTSPLLSAATEVLLATVTSVGAIIESLGAKLDKLTLHPAAAAPRTAATSEAEVEARHRNLIKPAPLLAGRGARGNRPARLTEL